MVEKISAVTLRVANMRASVRFYKDVLGLEIIYGSEGSYFTSLRTRIQDALKRIHWPGRNSPAVCLIDSGVNRAHPLSEPILDSQDMST